MSDLGRKDVSDQVSEKVTPDSQKSTTDKVSESASGAYDKVAGSVQPGDSKSTSQKLSDSTRSGTDETQNQGKGVVGSVQDTVSGAMDSASKAISGDSSNK